VNRDLLEAAVALAAALTQENAALAATDLAGAAALLRDKERVTLAFTAAQRRAARQPAAALTPAERAVAEQLERQLAGLAAENRRLLERAMLVQRRLVGGVAKAVPKATAGVVRYGASGAMATAHRPPPIMMSARV